MKVRHCVCGDNNAAIGGLEKEELMKRAIMGASAAAAIAMASLCIAPAQAHADDPCAGITDPAARQACIDEPRPDAPNDRYQIGGGCQASPDYGQDGQFCRN